MTLIGDTRASCLRASCRRASSTALAGVVRVVYVSRTWPQRARPGHRTKGADVNKGAESRFDRPGMFVDVERVAPIVEAFRRRTSEEGINSLAILGERVGTSERRLRRILEGPREVTRGGRSYVEGARVSIEFVDRLLIAVDCHELLYREPTNEDKSDGFADVYFHPAVVGEVDPAEISAFVENVNVRGLLGAFEAVAA